VTRFRSFARRFGLMTTGGSDYHGSAKNIELGACYVPDSLADELFNARPARCR
jgi:hypothetical protein